MNRREAKAYALRCLSTEARHHVSNGSEWLTRPLKSDGLAVGADGEFHPADAERVRRAVVEVANELETRAKRLSREPPQKPKPQPRLLRRLHRR